MVFFLNAEYIKQVKMFIIATKEQAVIFKQNGRLDIAKIAIIRIKLMNEEVAEVESG
jgi:hypothetical protein